MQRKNKISAIINLVLPEDNKAIYDNSQEISRRKYSNAFFKLRKYCNNNRNKYKKLHSHLEKSFHDNLLGQVRAWRCYQGIEFLSGENRLYAYRKDFLHQNWNTAFRTVEETIWLIAWITGILPKNNIDIKEWFLILDKPFYSIYRSLQKIAKAKNYVTRGEMTILAAKNVVNLIKKLEKTTGSLPLSNKPTIYTLKKYLKDPSWRGQYGQTNAHIKWKKAANKIMQSYAKFDQIISFALVSSLAVGWGDKYSDLDIVAFCKEIPLQKHRNIISKTISDKKASYSQSEQMDNFIIDNVPGHIVFIPIHQQEQALLTLNKTINSQQSNISYLQHSDFNYCVPLMDKTEIKKIYKKMALNYPQEYRQKIIKRECSFLEECKNILIQSVNKKSLVAFYLTIAYAGISIAYLLCALNSQHCDNVGLKWANRILQPLKIKPFQCLDRINRLSLNINKNNLNQKMAQFNKLFEELKTLIKLNK